MLAIIQCTMSCLSVSYPKISRLKYTELQFCQSLCLGVKLSHSEGVWEQGAEILGPKRDKVAGEWRSERDLWFVLLTKYHLCDQIKNEMEDRWQALVNMVMNKWVWPIDGNFLTTWGPVSFSGRTLLHGISQWSITKHLCIHNLQNEKFYITLVSNLKSFQWISFAQINFSLNCNKIYGSDYISNSKYSLCGQ